MTLVQQGEGEALKVALDKLKLDGETFVLAVDKEGVGLD